MPWSAADYADIEADINATLDTYGVPPRPAGRVWLLRPPPGFACLDDVLGHLLAVATAVGDDMMPTRSLAAHVDRELRLLFVRRPDPPSRAQAGGPSPRREGPS